MINVLNDIHGISGNNLVIPFTIDSSNLRNTALTVEVIGKIGGKFVELPRGLVYVVKENDTEEPLDTITPVYFENLFVVRFNTTTHNVQEIYIRVFNKDVSFVSPKITICRDLDLEFATTPKELAFRPKTVKVTDNVHCIYNGTVSAFTRDKFNIEILISNNANSKVPVWENVTDAYLSGAPLTFKNTEKDDSKPWSVSLKYKIRKTIGDSTVQISDIALLVL